MLTSSWFIVTKKPRVTTEVVVYNCVVDDQNLYAEVFFANKYAGCHNQQKINCKRNNFGMSHNRMGAILAFAILCSSYCAFGQAGYTAKKLQKSGDIWNGVCRIWSFLFLYGKMQNCVTTTQQLVFWRIGAYQNLPFGVQ